MLSTIETAPYFLAKAARAGRSEISNNGFSNTAIKFSISSSSQNFGDLGWINSKSLSENISKIISTMNIGEISSPIKRNNSILFLKLEDISFFSRFGD